MNETLKRMEELRKKLNEVVENANSCCEENVLKVSQELDKLIFEYMKAESAR